MYFSDVPTICNMEDYLSSSIEDPNSMTLLLFVYLLAYKDSLKPKIRIIHLQTLLFR